MTKEYQDSAQFKLKQEAEAAKTLLAHLSAMGDADDEQTIHDSFEGETSFIEAVAEVIKAIREDEAHIAALKDLEASYEARRKRLDGHKEALRAALEVGLSTAFEGVDQKRVKTAFGTVALGKSAQKLIVTDESALPTKYWKAADPTLDKKSLLSDLKSLTKGENIPGAELSNGGQQLIISKS